MHLAPGQLVRRDAAGQSRHSCGCRGWRRMAGHSRVSARRSWLRSGARTGSSDFECGRIFTGWRPNRTSRSTSRGRSHRKRHARTIQADCSENLLVSRSCRGWHQSAVGSSTNASGWHSSQRPVPVWIRKEVQTLLHEALRGRRGEKGDADCCLRVNKRCEKVCVLRVFATNSAGVDLAAKRRQHVAVGVSRRNRTEQRSKPRSGDSISSPVLSPLRGFICGLLNTVG